MKAIVKVCLGERQVLFVAPDTGGTRKWGVYGCPDMYRAVDGSIVVYDSGNMDSYDKDAGAIAPPVAFHSVDNGLSWRSVDPDQYGQSGKFFVLHEGGRVQFLPKTSPVDLHVLCVEPRCLVMTPNECGLIGLFRYADIALCHGAGQKVPLGGRLKGATRLLPIIARFPAFPSAICCWPNFSPVALSPRHDQCKVWPPGEAAAAPQGCDQPRNSRVTAE